MTSSDTELIMRTVAITGTRNTGHRSLDEWADLFAEHLAPYADSHFYIGGAKGIDSLTLLWLAGNTRAHITIVVPGRVDQQPAEARQAIVRTQDRIKDIVELKAVELKSPAFHERNRYMVDRSRLVIGFPHPDEPTSGTWQTINYAAGLGLPRLIVPV
jgi:predicted Rossmann fold nucleotide-binding protein DprA/Smf involved in DNA uptake